VADRKPVRFVMMPATRDAIATLFSRPGRTSIERDAEGRYWAGVVTRRGTMRHHPGDTVHEAIETALADPETAPTTLEEASRR
jgi:hypothetical protein